MSLGSYSLIGEHGSDGRLLLSKQSLLSPPELVSMSADGLAARQLTHFNRERLANTALGRVGEVCFGLAGVSAKTTGVCRGELKVARSCACRRVTMASCGMSWAGNFAAPLRSRNVSVTLDWL